MVKNIVDEKEREIWVGESRAYLGEDNTLNIAVVGDVDENVAIALEEATSELRNMAKGKVNYLIDLNGTGRASAKARKVFQVSIMDEKTGKIALFGLHPVAKVIASFVMGVTKKKDVRFFKTKEEALAWLKE